MKRVFGDTHEFHGKIFNILYLLCGYRSPQVWPITAVQIVILILIHLDRS